MTVLPIVARELRTASRRKGTYWNRAASAAIAGTVFGLIFLVGSSEPAQGLGKSLFVSLSVIFLGVSLLTGVVYTADSISEEKREGTLGLLFLTDLRGYDVVLGKLAASSVGAIYAVLAILPVLAIPLLMGGVSLGEFGRVVLVLVNAMFLSLAAGVMVSSYMRQGLTSMAMTLAVVLAVNLGPPLIAVWTAYVTGGDPPESMIVPSTGYALAVAQESLFKNRPILFVASVAVTHLLAWAFLVLASERTRRVWQESPSSDAATWRERLALWLRGNAERRRRWRETAMEANPAYWLGGRPWYKGWIVWAVLGGLGLLWLAAHLEWGTDWSEDEGVAFMTMLALHTLLRWWLSAEACAVFGPERKSGALELLLCTGLKVSDIVRGRAMALHRQFSWPSVGVLLVDLWMLTIVLGNSPRGEAYVGWVSCFFCLGAVFVVDMVALAWLGLWWGLVCRRASRALLRSAALIFGLPWALLIALLILMIVSNTDLPEPELLMMLLIYGFVAIGVSWFGGRWARERLLDELRRATAGEAGAGIAPPPGPAKALGREL